jgi:hypothetical protein
MKQQRSGSKQKISFIPIRIAALFTGAAILFCACENNLEQIKAFSSPENLPIGEAINIETLFTDSGQVRFMMKAQKLLQFENENGNYFEFPEGIELVKYDAHKNIISSITSNYAKQFVKKKNGKQKTMLLLPTPTATHLKPNIFSGKKKKKKFTPMNLSGLFVPTKSSPESHFNQISHWKTGKSEIQKVLFM